MKTHALRLYVASIALLVFFVLWAVIAARPWAQTSAAAARPELDPRLVKLNRWERHLRHESQLVNRTLNRRWSEYRKRLRAREAQIRLLKQRHAREVAAARAAQARLASAAAASYVPSAASAASYAGGSSTRVVTLPPTVRVVTLPPASASTSSGSSHP